MLLNIVLRGLIANFENRCDSKFFLFLGFLKKSTVKTIKTIGDTSFLKTNSFSSINHSFVLFIYSNNFLKQN